MKNYDLFGWKIDFSFTTKKNGKIYKLSSKNFFKIQSKWKNYMSLKNLINYDNAFNLNRINTSSQVEGDEALTIGLNLKEKIFLKKIFFF